MEIDEKEIVFSFRFAFKFAIQSREYTEGCNNMTFEEIYKYLVNIDELKVKQKEYEIVAFYKKDIFFVVKNIYGEFNFTEIPLSFFKSDMLFKLRSFLRNQ